MERRKDQDMEHKKDLPLQAVNTLPTAKQSLSQSSWYVFYPANCWRPIRSLLATVGTSIGCLWAESSMDDGSAALFGLLDEILPQYHHFPANV